ncbi:MAG: low molecular weight phosphotyrosine protein phosphatase [Akkermansiaceae bacterium]|nr:low molecular weight phosphotyrosine protein phosphatase [Akkermansiaceae bacterium]
MKSTHVLFVCMGNICRSPAGENIFRHLVKEAGLSKEIICDSAGTLGYHTGNNPDTRMSRTIRKRDYDVTGYARQFSLHDFEAFDLILTMDDENYANIIALAKSEEQKARVHRFTDYCTEHDHREVPDPYYGGDGGFELVADLIEDGTRGLLNHLTKK